MNRHEKEKFIAEKNNEINNIFEELAKSKKPHKEFAKAKEKIYGDTNRINEKLYFRIRGRYKSDE